MADWLDSNTLIESAKRWYRFEIAPGFWSFIEAQAERGVLLASSLVYDELVEGNDAIADWARARRTSPLVVDPAEPVQHIMSNVGQHVTDNYEDAHARKFLEGADPWVIAHALSDHGRVITLEKWDEPRTKKVKIPRVCGALGVECPTNPFLVLQELGLRLG